MSLYITQCVVESRLLEFGLNAHHSGNTLIVRSPLDGCTAHITFYGSGCVFHGCTYNYCDPLFLGLIAKAVRMYLKPTPVWYLPEPADNSIVPSIEVV